MQSVKFSNCTDVNWLIETGLLRKGRDSDQKRGKREGEATGERERERERGKREGEARGGSERGKREGEGSRKERRGRVGNTAARYSGENSLED